MTVSWMFLLLLLSLAFADDETRAADGTCPSGVEYVPVSWGQTQQVTGAKAQETLQVIERTRKYMTEQVFVDDRLALVRNDCKLKFELCSFWAAIGKCKEIQLLASYYVILSSNIPLTLLILQIMKGECDNNPKFMMEDCAPACQSCDQLHYQTRCTYDDKLGVWKEEGDLTTMFQTIFDEYQPTILSQDPWVLLLDDFLTADECQSLRVWGTKIGYVRSGESNHNGTSTGIHSDQRTSTNTWCLKDCYQDPKIQGISAKIEQLTGIPESHCEYLQLLQYENGQYYKRHHDLGAPELNRPQGVRILTVFLYLNDVEAGGGTHFPQLGITVEAKRGRAVIWPNVLDDRSNSVDIRTEHEALPVEKGIKYGANGM
jgi:prolyl 4-hydroxylase